MNHIEFNQNLKIYDEIVNLIDLHYEGEYWDFKKQWYSDARGDMLHDIICMANNLVNRDAYIIIGVDEENDYKICDVRNDEKRLNTQMIVDFLKDKHFAGNIRPRVHISPIAINGSYVDVIVIENQSNTPFYLTKLYNSVRPNVIYTRVQDTNTPKDSNADLQHIEYLWKKRFGLVLSPLERIYTYLQHTSEWVDIPTDYETEGKYYRFAPEFTIRRTLDPEDGRDGYEYYLFGQTDTRPHWSEIRLFYHQTLMAEFGGAYLDGGRCFTTTPIMDGFSTSSGTSWDIAYSYMVKGSPEHLISEFYYDSNSMEQRHAHTCFENSIMIFESEDEHQMFNWYAEEHWCCKDKYTKDIYEPYFPELANYNMQHFKEQYRNVQILKNMLREMRSKQ